MERLPAHIGQGQAGSGSLAPATPHGRPEPSGDDELPPAAKRLRTAMREGRDTPSPAPSSAPRTMNRLHAWATGNIAATAAEEAAAAAAAAAGNQGAPSDEEKVAGEQEVEQWFSEEDSSSPNVAGNDEDKTQ
jgi:hypothetical protein